MNHPIKTILRTSWSYMYIQENRTLNSCTLTICEYFMWPSTQAGDGDEMLYIRKYSLLPKQFSSHDSHVLNSLNKHFFFLCFDMRLKYYHDGGDVGNHKNNFSKCNYF